MDADTKIKLLDEYLEVQNRTITFVNRFNYIDEKIRFGVQEVNKLINIHDPEGGEMSRNWVNFVEGIRDLYEVLGCVVENAAQRDGVFIKVMKLPLDEIKNNEDLQ